MDRHRERDGDRVPRIDEKDPLPAASAPTGRWAVPYVSDKTGKPTVLTNHPLTPAHTNFGLSSCLSADTFDRLKELMDEEDEKCAAFSIQQISHRNTG